MPRETSDRGGIARTDVEGEAGSGVIAVAHSAIEPPEPPPSVLERIVHRAVQTLFLCYEVPRLNTVTQTARRGSTSQHRPGPVAGSSRSSFKRKKRAPKPQRAHGDTRITVTSSQGSGVSGCGRASAASLRTALRAAPQATARRCAAPPAPTPRARAAGHAVARVPVRRAVGVGGVFMHSQSFDDVWGPRFARILGGRMGTGQWIGQCRR